MANQKPCVRCGRPIDEYARACPYCNWWQDQPVPAQQQPAQATPAAAAEYVPPPDHRARNKLIGLIAGGVLVLLAFILGAFFHGSDPVTAAQSDELAKNAPAAAPAPSSPRTTVKLVPVTEGAPPPVFEGPVTGVEPTGATSTAPPGATDFTALPADQYAAAAARQQAAQQQAGGNFVDPRSITGNPYAQPARPAQPQQPRRIQVVQTQPVPVFQPVPHVRVDREETARLFLTVGTDGRVHDIGVARAAPSVMGPLVANVQQWRFRPAMQNGQPVSSRFSVAVTFKP